MDIKTFGKNILERMDDKLPDYYDRERFKYIEIPKNNGQILHGIIAPIKDVQAAPIEYIDKYFDEYQRGSSISEITDEIVERYLTYPPANEVIKNDLLEYDNVKDHLQVRIYDAELNKERLKDKVHYIDGDFAVCYAVNISEDDGLQSFLVTDKLLDAWDIEPDELHTDAIEADLKRGVQFCSLPELMLCKMGAVDDAKNYFTSDHANKEPMYVLTNTTGMYGSGLIESEQVRERIAEVLEDSFYILPSSLHEVIIVPEEDMDIDELNNIVKTVNEDVVDIDDFLSDKVQYCDEITLKMENAKLHELRTKEVKNEF